MVYSIWVTLFTWNVWFCFAKVVQADLDRVKGHWNSHHIRPSMHDTVSEVPDVLFFLPEYSGATDCLIPVTLAQVDEMDQYCELPQHIEEYAEYF